MNVQHWTEDKNIALITHLKNTDPDVILITSTSKLAEHNPIRIQNYHTFATNKNNERHAGSAVAIKYGIKFEVLNKFQTDFIGIKIQTTHGPVIITTVYSPPRHNTISQQDLNYVARNHLPAILIADLNARHPIFGYKKGTNNTKGNQMNNHIYNNRINHIGPTFNTFFTRNSATKPDVVLTNNRFFFNYLITPGGLGPSDHLTINIQISAKPIIVQKEPYESIKNTDWEKYKNILSNIEEINLQGKTIEDLNQEFENLYEQIEKAKKEATPLKTQQTRQNMKPSAKFKRLTKILDKYSQALLRGGLTEHLSKQIREIQLMLIQEGNECKWLWWEEQIMKIEEAAKDNKRFWKQIDRLSGKKRQQTPFLKYKENGIEKIAKTDEEKTEISTRMWKEIYKITPEENKQFDEETERRVNQTIESNADKLLPKRTINLNEIR